MVGTHLYVIIVGRTVITSFSEATTIGSKLTNDVFFYELVFFVIAVSIGELSLAARVVAGGARPLRPRRP